MCFNSAKNALDALFSESNPDLLLLDVRMPEISGPAFCEKVRSKDDLKNLRIVFFTASGKEDVDEILIKKYNVLGFISKPFDMQDLQVQIEKYLIESGR